MHSHRGEDRAALKRAARLVRADPEHLDADHDADRRQDAGEEDERGVGRRAPERRRPAAPEPVRRDRPHAHDREHEHDLFEHRVERAIGDKDGRDRIAEAGRGEFLVRLGGERGGGIGQVQHGRREDARDEDREQAGRDLQPGARRRIRRAAAGRGAPRPTTSRTPVTPLPIAASVRATSGA